ncbi:MAG: bifunctional proline dehydrogenase/L-glutamate gamma-semialdehyde dehydrogenase PutA [Nitrosomonas sp.]|nr:bifunctional proline dehydrogenase/L-glutamate gamma-semialdehyde dehydrogenase PutA [Nitrosomonas sp.]
MHSDTLKAARHAINQAYLANEASTVQHLLAQLTDYPADAVSRSAQALLEKIRYKPHQARQSLTQAFLTEYQLNSDEGIALMTIAEALLRIPDKATQDRFLTDRLSAVDWRPPAHHSDLLTRMAIEALAFSGSLERRQLQIQTARQQFHSVMERLLLRLGQPVIRIAIKKAMHILGAQFVFAETIEQAICKSADATGNTGNGIRYSFDMLGEAAITAADADRFFAAYQQAITQLAASRASDAEDSTGLYANPGISVKLSALYPRYEPLQHTHAVPELTFRLTQLAIQARKAGITLTLDAEESERLDMALDIFAAVFMHPELDNWPGLGLAVQAYQKRAVHVIRWLAQLAKSRQRGIPVRLVKGAYWDSEIKRAQENGLDGYPVFTRKSATDISYLACARLLINAPDCFFPQFATHNAHTVTAIMQMAQGHSGYEFQRLHGMGEALYQAIRSHVDASIPCRIYAPVGGHQELLPYLVRRLLENGANTSFINQVENPDILPEEITRDPVTVWLNGKPEGLPLPAALYGPRRRNAQGLNLADSQIRQQIQQALNQLAGKFHQAAPWIDGRAHAGRTQAIAAPYDHREIVGEAVYGDREAAAAALDAAVAGFDSWRLQPVEQRTACLLKAADLMEQQRMHLVSLCVREGGRTIRDALAEVREAVDFCRYYAANALELFSKPVTLPGPTGEINQLRYSGRGVFVCISPWNFPVAIFTGQIAAALVAGNTVIAKPAERTTLTAMACARIFYQAGIPESVLHFLPGKGTEIGPQLIGNRRVAGVAFTGSTATAQWINQQLSGHPVIAPFIAETGGQNVLIADSSAHKEQLVQDAVLSAFNSAGQRCSALRVLFVPHEIADRIKALLIGAMQQLRLGSPADYAADIGPVISASAVMQLKTHISHIRALGNTIYQLPLLSGATYLRPTQSGYFYPPTLIELQSMEQLREEVFGPVLHLVRYASNELNAVIETVNASGYGLTLGIHSRIQHTIETIRQRARVGNIYINRNMIGAVVGVQPFGGMGLSGTGPKAGGPDYLRRFAVEQTITDNVAALGGNTGLLTQDLL